MPNGSHQHKGQRAKTHTNTRIICIIALNLAQYSKQGSSSSSAGLSTVKQWLMNPRYKLITYLSSKCCLACPSAHLEDDGWVLLVSTLPENNPRGDCTDSGHQLSMQLTGSPALMSSLKLHLVHSKTGFTELEFLLFICEILIDSRRPLGGNFEKLKIKW